MESAVSGDDEPMKTFLQMVLDTIRSIVRDPVSGDASSARLIAWGCAVVGWIIALKHSDGYQMVGVLIGGGAVALLARKKAE